MKLDKKQLAQCRDKLQQITGHAPVIFSNGIFEFVDVSDKDKANILDKLKQLGYIRNLNAPFYRNDNGEELFKINGIINLEQVSEAIEVHDELNPKLWDGEALKLPVKEKIIEIAQYFKEQLENDGIDLKIADIYLLGSNANYNYTDKSDLDIHIIADESFDCSEEHLPIIYQAYKTLFNNKHDITINGINAEIYVENKDKINNVASGVYSINDGWIKKPARYEIPEIDDATLEKLVAQWENRYLDIEQAPDLKEVEKYLDDIYELRQSALTEEGEFGLGNLVFKEMRNLGYLDALKDLRYKLNSDQLSL